MRSQIGWKYFAIPIVYIGVILTLFYLQYSDTIEFPANSTAAAVQTTVTNKNVRPEEKAAVKPAVSATRQSAKPFSDSFSGLSIKGTAEGSQADRSGGVSELSVSGLGLTFAFTPAQSLKVSYRDGTSSAVKIAGYKKNQSDLELVFEDDLRIILSVQAGGSGLIMSTRVPEGRNQVASVSIPFEISDKAKSEFAAGVPAARLTVGGQSYFLTAQAGTEFSTSEKRVTVRTVGDRLIALEKTASGGQSPEAYWYSKNGSSVTENDYRETLAAFSRKAYAGWKTGRFDAAKGEWKTADGGFAYSDRAALYYLAETVSRGGLESAISGMAAAAKLHPGQAGYATNPYLGNLMNTTSRQDAEDDALAAKIRPLFSKKDPAVFADTAMLSYIIVRAPESIRKEFLEYVRTVNVRAANTRELLGMAYVLLEGKPFPPETLTPYFGTILADRILPGVVRAGSSMFLQDSTGKINASDSLLAGSLLLRSGKKTGNTHHESTGRNLAVSVLSLADDNGFIPKTITVTNQSALRKEGLTAPEDVYGWVTENRYLPKRVDLPRIGAETWVWTIADVTVEEIKGGFRLSFSYPVNGTHSLVINGLPQFREIHMYGLKWRTTNLFQDYVYGCYYDPAVRKLYMKIRNKEAKESVLLYYSDVPAPPVQTEPAVPSGSAAQSDQAASPSGQQSPIPD